MKAGYVYKLLFPTGHFYIGSSQELNKRLNRHQSELELGKHHNSKMQWLYEAVKTYDIVFDTFESIERARENEGTLITASKDNPLLLNIGLGAIGGDNLTNNPNRDVIIEKMRKSVNDWMSVLTPDERKEKFGSPGSKNPMYGKTHSAETRLILSQASIGNSHAKGAVRTDEMKAAISLAASKRVGDLNHFFGREHSDSSKRKIALANKGRLPANTKRVSIEGVEYASATSAAKALNVSVSTILNRINNPHERFSEYRNLE